MSAGAWLRAARPLAHANLAPPILLGQALALDAFGVFDPILAAVAFGFGVVDHLAIVFANDYADRDADALGSARTIFSGGSRVIPEGRIRPEALRAAALAAAAALVVGAAIAGALLERMLFPAFAAVALILLHSYSFPPLRLSYRGGGELLQGLGVGLVLPLLGWYAQTGELASAPFEVFAALVILGLASNVLTALPDLAADRAAAKRTWPVRRGPGRARRDALLLVGLGLALATWTAALGPTWTALVVGPPAACALAALGFVREDRPLLPFVALAAGASPVLQVAWAIALFAAPR